MIYAIIFILLLGFELCFLRFSSIVDSPTYRSSHYFNTKNAGGILFFIIILMWTIFFGFHYSWFLVGLTAIALVSLIDDIRPLPNKPRLLVHFIAVLLMFQQWGILNVESWWMIVVALIVCTGIINAYNFMDGINGITGGYSLAVIIPLYLANLQFHFVEPSLLRVVILSIVVFGIFNFRKRAKCFAGDVGAVGIAYIVLFALGLLILATGNIFYIMFLAVYGVDSVLTIVHRLMLHENIFQPHRKHAYQLMANELHIPHLAVSGIYFVLQLAISIGLIYSPISQWLYSVIVLALLIIVYIAFKHRYYHLHEQYLKSQIV